MKNFKVEVSKGDQRISFIRKAETEALLREEIHKEGFTILAVQVMGDIVVSGSKYYFEILQNGAIKTGTISSSDIFKAYIKIKYDLKYDLKYIYQEIETSLEEKIKIIKNLEDQYGLYLQLNKKEIKKEQDIEDVKLKNVTEVNIENFAMKKEVEETYKIIDKVLLKLKNVLTLENNNYLDTDKKLLLKEIYNSIFRLKNSTNLLKLKQVGELGLVKIGEIELKILEDTKDKKVKELLTETNKLLKQVGSKKYFIEKEKDINYILGQVGIFIKEIFVSNEVKPKKELLDKKSFGFLKTKLLFEKYSAKLDEVQKEIYKNFIIYLYPSEKNIEKREELELKKKVIKQNIMIFESRLKGETFSYTKIAKGYNFFIEKLILLLNIIQGSFIVIIYIYSFIFFMFFSLNYLGLINFNYNFGGLFYFLVILLATLLISYIRGVFSLILNLVILLFFFIFGVINF